jgi:hypothetical protein
VARTRRSSEPIDRSFVEAGGSHVL